MLFSLKTTENYSLSSSKHIKLMTQKFKKIKAHSIGCIEIDLNHVDQLVDGQINLIELRAVIEDDTNFKYWLYNSLDEILLEKEKIDYYMIRKKENDFEN